MKPVLWVGSSLGDLKRFPVQARRLAGLQLYAAQQGWAPFDQKPMADVGAGVYEIRVRTGQEHRVFYIAKFVEGLYVLHAFEKKTRRTAAKDLDLGRRRYRELLRHRRALGMEGGTKWP